MLKLIIRLSALLIGICYATSTSNPDVQQSQMSSLNERVNQMISSLYTPSLLSKSKPSSPTPSSSNDSPTTYESPPYAYSPYPPAGITPQFFYLPPTPNAVSPPNPTCYLETGLQPADYTYPVKSNLYPRAAYPFPFTYDNNYSPVSYPVSPYPPFSYPPYPCQYPPIPKPSPYTYSDYPAPINQQRIAYPPFPNSPPYHPPVPFHPSPYQSSPPPYPPHYRSPPPPYPQPNEQASPFYSPPPYPNHSEVLPQPHYT